MMRRFFFMNSVWFTMNSKKYKIKYVHIISYIVICFLLLLIKINYSTRIEPMVEEKNLNYPLSLNAIDNRTSMDSQTIDKSLQLISSVCEKYNETSSLERKHYYYSSNGNGLFCWIRKVGSTSFTELFAELRGIEIQKNYYKESKVLSPESIEEFLNLVDDGGVFKFLAVRHPFERLVSTFRSRIEDNSQHSSQSWIFVPRIFYLTRPELFHFNETIGNPLQRIFDNNRRLKLVPTFEEFILWLLKQPDDNDDEHWSKYHSHCSICQMNFDFVLKIDENLNEQLDYVFTRLNSTLKHRKLLKLGVTRGGTTDYQVTCKYLSTLKKSTIDNLYERYKIDFEMFNYDLEMYKLCRRG